MYLFLGVVASAPTRDSSEMGSAAAGYRPRAPEQGALHTVVRTHLEAFLRAAAERTDGAGLPRFVEDEFRDFLTCGVLEHGFARLRCEGCGLDHLLPFSCKGRGFCPSCGGRRMTERAAHAVDAVLPPVPVRQWVLSLPHWLRYVLAWNHGLCRAVLAVYVQAPLGFQRPRHAHLDGFDLHANVAVDGKDRERLEQLCRYLLRPAVAQDRLRLTEDGRVVLELKTVWAGGTSHLVFEPLDLLARLAALVPRPRVNLIFYHRVLAPHARLRAAVVSYGAAPPVEPPPAISVSTAPDAPSASGGRLRLIATILDPATIRAILHSMAWRPRPPIGPRPAHTADDASRLISYTIPAPAVAGCAAPRPLAETFAPARRPRPTVGPLLTPKVPA